MRKVLLLCVCVLMVSGCATYEQTPPPTVDRRQLVADLVECLHESAINKALVSDDFNYIRASIRNTCDSYERNLENSYPPEFRVTARSQFSENSRERSERATAWAMDILRNKKDYLDEYHDCTFEKITDQITQKQIWNDTASELNLLCTEAARLCYDQVLTPYIGKRDSRYSRERREKIIAAEAKAHVSAILSAIQKPAK